MTGPKRFLAPEVLAEAVAQIAALARRERAHVALIGGFALQYYGSPRLTGDVDVASSKPIEALPDEKPLSFGGYKTTAPNGVPVDVVMRDDVYEKLYDAALSTAARVRGAAMLVARPEYLAAMKMVAGRKRDEDDLEFLVANVIDVRKTRKVFGRFLGPYAVQELDRIIEEVEWKVQKGRL